MKISFKNYPIDIIMCILWSTILLPVTLLDIGGIARVILGLPFILFIPGYILIFALFPNKKTDTGIDIIERIALSFGLSIAIVPLIGLGLNYTTWGIRLEPILISLFIFVTGVGTIAIYRWMKNSPTKRFTISFELSIPKHKNKIDQALTLVLIASIIIACGSLVYAIVIPKTGEKFTEFYLLGKDGIADEYPKSLTLGEETSLIIGIANHEYKTTNYTIEVWLIEQSTYFDESTNENKTSINHTWFMDKMTTTLKHENIDIEKQWMPQWEHNYTFSINKTGDFKLAFLLFTSETDDYSSDIDYTDIIEEKISSAYRECHLWIEAI